MKKLITCLALAAALFAVAPAQAQFAESNKPAGIVTGPGVTTNNLPGTVYLPNAKQDGPLGAIAVAPAQHGTIDIGQAFSDALAPYINAAMSALVYAAMGWIFWLLKNKLNINIDAEHRASITAAAQRQASSLVADGMVSLQGKTITVDSVAMADAVNHLTAAAPDAIAHFGVTPEAIEARIKDMIPQVPAVAPAVAAAAVESAPLPPPQAKAPS